MPEQFEDEYQQEHEWEKAWTQYYVGYYAYPAIRNAMEIINYRYRRAVSRALQQTIPTKIGID